MWNRNCLTFRSIRVHTPDFSRVRTARCFLCSVLLVLLVSFFCPFYCISSDLRLLITPLISWHFFKQIDEHDYLKHHFRLRMSSLLKLTSLILNVLLKNKNQVKEELWPVKLFQWGLFRDLDNFIWWSWSIIRHKYENSLVAFAMIYCHNVSL